MVFLHGMAMDEYIIDHGLSGCPTSYSDSILGLKNPKWKAVETESAERSIKCSKEVRLFNEFDLPETGVCIQLGKHLSSCQLDKGVLH